MKRMLSSNVSTYFTMPYEFEASFELYEFNTSSGNLTHYDGYSGSEKFSSSLNQMKLEIEYEDEEFEYEMEEHINFNTGMMYIYVDLMDYCEKIDMNLTEPISLTDLVDNFSVIAKY